MKRAISGIVTCLYLVFTSGIQLQFHYCMGHLEGTSVSVLPDNKCNTCGMASGKSTCCHTESQWLKVGDNHQPAFASVSLPAPVEIQLVAEPYFYTKLSQLSVNEPTLTGNHSPPLLSFSGQLHIYYCVFRV